MSDDLNKPITMTAVVDRWVMYTDASGNERPAHVVRETKIDGVTVLMGGRGSRSERPRQPLALLLPRRI